MTQHASAVAEIASVSRVPATINDNALLELARLRNGDHLRLDDVLPRRHFLKHVQREKLRTDRSKAPLSIALFSSDSDRSDLDSLLALLKSIKRETDILGYLGQDRVAILLPDTNEQGAQRLTQKILDRADGLRFSTMAQTYPDQLFNHLITESPDEDTVHPLFLDSDATETGQPGYLLKRVLDIVGGSAAILLLSPLMLVTAMAVWLTSPGPVIFKQIRLGRRGVPFAFYKFRSMYCNADDRIHREYVGRLIQGAVEEINQGDKTKPLYKLNSDPRVTRVGGFIRKTSLDELPQLFNVVKGDMSLVGPRPPVPYEVEKYQSWHLRRILEGRPGITGLWQVEGRSKTSFDDMVRLDLRYLRNCSFLLDLKILIKTVKVVLEGDGAR